MITEDAALRRSKARLRADMQATRTRLETEIRNVARKIAHHGPDNLIATMRERANVALNRDWAESLCREYGWKG